MTVFYGQVSHKNGLGQARMVTATDDYNFAQAYGIDGFPGGISSNQKINMLDLNPDAGHSIVAVDPNEMQSISNLEYLRNHVSGVVDWGQMATAIENTNAGYLQNVLNQIRPNVSVNTLTNYSRGILAKFLCGAASRDDVLNSLDNQTPFMMLTDSLKRLSPQLHATTEGTIGGVDFTLVATGTSAVSLTQAGTQYGQVTLPFKIHGRVLGSASRAGAKYKTDFVKIRQAVTKAAIEDYHVNVRFSVHADLSAVIETAQMKMTQTQQMILNQQRMKIEQQFADLEPYNPASTKARIWAELGITNSDVPQTKLDDVALHQYAAGEITAEQFANIPANHMVEKLNDAIKKRFDNADLDALAQTAIEEIRQDHPVDNQHLQTVQAYAVQQLPKYLDQVFNQIGHNTNFADAMYWYHASNQALVSQLMPLIKADVANYIDSQLPEMANEAPEPATTAPNEPTEQLNDYAAETKRILGRVTSLDSMQADSVKQRIIAFLKQDAWSVDGDFINSALTKAALYWSAKVAAAIAMNGDQLQGQLTDLIKEAQNQMQTAHNEYAQKVAKAHLTDDQRKHEELILKQYQDKIDNLMPQSPDDWADFIVTKFIEGTGDDIVEYYHRLLTTEAKIAKDRMNPHIDEYVHDDAQADAVRDLLQTMSTPDFIQAISAVYPDTKACIKTLVQFGTGNSIKSEDDQLDRYADRDDSDVQADQDVELTNRVDQYFEQYVTDTFIPTLVQAFSSELGGATQYQNELHDAISTIWDQELTDQFEEQYLASLHFTNDNYRILIAQTLNNHLDQLVQATNEKMDWSNVQTSVLNNLSDLLNIPAVRTVDGSTWHQFAESLYQQAAIAVNNLNLNDSNSQFYVNVTDNYALLDYLDPDWQDDVQDYAD